MHQEIVAIALEIIANEFEIVAVSDIPNSLGKERFIGFDFFQADRSLLACDLGDAGKFVDQIACRQPAHRECKFRTERQTMQNSTERKSDHRRGNRTTENDDDGMFADEHVQIAAHEHHH